MSVQLLTSAGDACLYVGALFASEPIDNASLVLPSLQRFVARAESHSVPVCDSVSFANWVAGIPDRGPAAAICRFADTGKTDAHCWLRADPVQLLPAHDTLRLFAATAALDSRHDAALINSVAGHLAQDGWLLEVSSAGNWYLRAPGELRCETTSTERVEGADVFPFMPGGEDAGRLRSLMNDVQMLLHQHADGNPMPVNSIWPWGEGCWHDAPAAPGTPVGPAFTRHPYLIGLWRHWGAACAAPDGASEAMQAGGGFVAIPDLARSAAGLEALERRWLAPSLRALSAGRIKTVSLVLHDGHCLRLSRSGLRRFWRRPRSTGDTLSRLTRAAAL